MTVRRPGAFLPGLLVATALAWCPARAQSPFVTFESGQVRPLALSPDGTRLVAVNTPDARLELFDVGPDGLTHRGSVAVGLEPVAVAARTNGEFWVVNQLSDSISVVDAAAEPPRVVRTLLVGDEPRDVVFAGPGGGRAFVTAAHRGQNRPGDPQLTTPGVGRADVWVFDAARPDAPPTILTLFGDTPRALAVSPDGATVYAAVFQSGNQTTTVTEGAVCDGGATAPPCTIAGVTMPGGLPAPNSNVEGRPGPETGLIVKFDPTTGAWRDPIGRDWRNAVRFSLPDLDVFAIDAMASTPVQTAAWPHVGTVLFNLAVNPASGKVYVTNTDARNEVRFEGPGILGGSTVRGNLHQARITVLDGPNVLPRHLNPHIDYAVVPSPPGTKERSLATPLGMAVDAAGGTLWVAAFGSSAVGVYDTAELEQNTFVPDVADHIALSGGGPSGLALDEAHARLYVLTRFDNAVKVVDTAERREIAAFPLHDPEPADVRDGRPLLYDARLTSSNGEASCAACHVFGDFDSLAWDLGNPDDVYVVSRNPSRLPLGNPDFHPLKGPMTTQSLRGMANHGPMHWRGDRTGGTRGGDPLDELAAFREFIVAFEGLLGRDGPIDDADMERFARFVLQVAYPPNPIRALTNRLTPAAAAGRALYFGRVTDSVQNCNGCHVLDPARGFFGTDGFSTFENEPQHFKIAHLRNLYQKVGMFGMPAVSGLFAAGGTGFQGDQVRGFGFLHDGSVDTLFRFHRAAVFTVTDEEARDLEQFVLRFDSNLAPVVGQQITLDGSAAADARLELLVERADEGECELIVRAVLGGEARGGVRTVSGAFQLDRKAEAPVDVAELRRRADQEAVALTFTCVPPGSGVRMGIDRDRDGALDRDELDAGTDPASPDGGLVDPPPSRRPTIVMVPATLMLRDGRPKRRRILLASPRGFRTTPPEPGSDADPTVAGASLRVYNATGATPDDVTVDLPAAGWRRTAARRGRRIGGRWTAPRGTTSAVRSVVVTGRRVVVRGGRAAWSYTLDEPQQRIVGARLRLGYPAAATVYCVAARSDLVRGSGRRPDAPGRFRGRGIVGTADDCPPTP
jgi:DNA-binding beta-propeller fold protein YncE/mono/diheme cytochrome c family protein